MLSPAAPTARDDVASPWGYPGEKRAATVGCLRSGYALPPAAHRLILIVADDLPIRTAPAPATRGSSEPSTRLVRGEQRQIDKAPHHAPQQGPPTGPQHQW